MVTTQDDVSLPEMYFNIKKKKPTSNHCQHHSNSPNLFLNSKRQTGEARQLYSIKILSKGAASYSTYTQHTSALFDLQQSNAAQQLSDYSRIYLNWPFLQV